ncbi:MAG: HupE/UreJ family protein [Casimicrobiaceae bacterium]
MPGGAAAREHTRLLRAILGFAALLTPALAAAHVEAGRAEGLLAGLHHPASGLDHVLAMVSVGLWGAELGAPAIWLLPVAFPIAMAFGGMLGLIGVPLPGVEIGIALSAVVLGAAVVTAWRPPLWIAAAIVGIFAIFHGHAHGTELPAGSSGLLYSIGFVVATGLLHATGIGIGTIHRWDWGRATLRAAGAGVATSGAYFLWQALA